MEIIKVPNPKEMALLISEELGVELKQFIRATHVVITSREEENDSELYGHWGPAHGGQYTATVDIAGVCMGFWEGKNGMFGVDMSDVEISVHQLEMVDKRPDRLKIIQSWEFELPDPNSLDKIKKLLHD